MRQHPSAIRSSSSAPDLTSTLFNRDGSPRLFLQPVVEGGGGAPSSYPEPRHLVGISTPDTGADAVGDGVFSVPGPVAPVPFVRSEPLPLGDGQKSEADWARERLEWETAYVLRELLAGYDVRLEADCGGEGKVLQHALSTRQRLTPYRCQTRATCPCCGRAYGLGRGAELVALLDAVLEPGRLVPVVAEVKAWHLVLSCDARLSDELGRLVNLDERDEVRRRMRHLTEDVDATVKRVFGPGAAAVVNWHWWNSSDPVSGRHHIHAHVTVPNVSVRLDAESGEWVPDLRPLRVVGKLDQSDLRELRYEFGRRVAGHRWVRALGVTAPTSAGAPGEWQPNAHVRFSTRRDGQGYAHRMRYDARSSVSDLLALVEPDELRDARQLHADVLSDEEVSSVAVDVAELACNEEGLRWWVASASVWQQVQTVRYTGWLVNAARKQLGLLKLKTSQDEPEWSSVGLYRVLNADNAGVTVERWTSKGREEQQWHFDHVELLPPPCRASSWSWVDSVRPVVTGGPPAAWLSRSGLG